MQSSGLQFRKWLLAVSVIAAFTAYSFVLRHQDSNTAVTASSPQKSKSTASSSSSASSGNGDSGATGNPSSSTAASSYKSGSYTGSVADAFYGNVQVKAVISGGKITDVEFLQFPNDSPNSQSINAEAVPALKQEALQSQSASVNIVTGATQTSEAFIQSLSSALNQAQS
jgi:uncharacterized protein with FMN-binding domain